MKKIAILLILLAACTSISYEEHTKAGSKYVLNNGMTVLLKENPDTGMIGIDLMIKRSIAADGEKHGLSFFTNRMLLSGTEKRTREQIVKEIEQAGGAIKARTYAEYSEIVIEIPSDKFSTALDVLQDVLLNPTFLPEEVERERTILIGELESKKDQPNVVAEELFMKAIYQGHPYEHPIDGYVETVKQITREDIINHYKEWYVPNNTYLSIAGNLKERATINAIQHLFKGMQQKQTPKETFEMPPRIQPITLTQNMPIESFYIQYGHQLVPAVHPDFIKLRMANAILGSGSGSRLFYELRDKRALAYTVTSIAPSTRSTGFMKIYMVTRPETLNESIAGITEQLELLKKEDVPEDEMTVVKQKIKGFFFLDHQKTIDQANYLGLYEMQGYGYEYDVEYPEKLAQVTPQEVKYVANTYFNNPATAITGPFEQAKIE
ncbi:insulinase family protein [Candidatus Woesearchaeota archaeon]|nr:insulinase family protein [Candidatus Woesearchaeota archaeon]